MFSQFIFEKNYCFNEYKIKIPCIHDIFVYMGIGFYSEG